MVGCERARIAAGELQRPPELKVPVPRLAARPAMSPGMKRELSRPQPTGAAACLRVELCRRARAARRRLGLHRPERRPPRYSATCAALSGVSAAPCGFMSPVVRAARMFSGGIICRNILCGALGTWPSWQAAHSAW